MSERFVTILLLAMLSACARKMVQTPPAPQLAQENAYFDLQPDSKLRIVLPLKSEGALPNFEIAQYFVVGHRGRRVTLKFLSAEIANDGKMATASQAPPLPFSLPPKAMYVRLLYLQRLSEADHNMAVIAAGRMAVLEAGTKQIRTDPSRCRSDAEFICSWVPPHVAVRPEK